MEQNQTIPNNPESITRTWSRDMYPLGGEIVPSEKYGEILVTVNGSPPFPVRNFSGIPARELMDKQYIGRTALLFPFNGNPADPIITSFEDSLLEEIMIREVKHHGNRMQLISRVDGKAVVIEAKDQIILKCGKGCITIRNNGTIEIDGTDISSRSKGSIRLKGSNIEVN